MREHHTGTERRNLFTNYCLLDVEEKRVVNCNRNSAISIKIEEEKVVLKELEALGISLHSDDVQLHTQSFRY